LEKVISKYGVKKDSRIGYPIGIGYPPTWGELTTSFRKGDENILKENYDLSLHSSFMVAKLWYCY